LVFIGHNGLTATVVKAIDDAFKSSELIKIKFIDFKEKALKEEMVESIGKKTVSTPVGMVGHIAIFFRHHVDPAKRKIIIPKRT
jgi:RNA-binding protein